MKLNRSKGRMFRSVDYTCTYYQGCDHNCLYCWTQFIPGGPISHEPKLIQTDEHELLDAREAVIFLNSAHDSFAECIPAEWIRAMLRWIGRQHESLEFYLQSKNPMRALDFLHQLRRVKHKAILSTTIETDRQDIINAISDAPSIFSRTQAMLRLGVEGFRLRLSLEPLYAFNYEALSDIVLRIKPELVEVGLDNYHRRHRVPIPQPSRTMYEALYDTMVEAGIKVNEKKSIKKWRENRR